MKELFYDIGIGFLVAYLWSIGLMDISSNPFSCFITLLVSAVVFYYLSTQKERRIGAILVFPSIYLVVISSIDYYNTAANGFNFASLVRSILANPILYCLLTVIIAYFFLNKHKVITTLILSSFVLFYTNTLFPRYLAGTKPKEVAELTQHGQSIDASIQLNRTLGAKNIIITGFKGCPPCKVAISSLHPIAESSRNISIIYIDYSSDKDFSDYSKKYLFKFDSLKVYKSNSLDLEGIVDDSVHPNILISNSENKIIWKQTGYNREIQNKIISILEEE